MKANQSKASKGAFTLIELLIVVAIIGILASIAVPNFLNAMIRAKIADVKSTLHTMELTIEQYRLDNNELPPHYNDPRQNLWMTTPIAYMSSRPYDPFQDFGSGAANPGWANYGPGEMQGAPHYEYIRTDDGLQVERSLALSGTPYLDWWIYTIGPDGYWSTENAQGLTVLYDASNGLHSNGDIVKFKADKNPSLLRLLH